jgi:plastocyanin
MRTTGLAVSVLAALALSAAAPAGAAARRADVNVQYSAYGPSQLDVLPGTVVTWSNVSSRTHTVTAEGGRFDSGHLGPGARFRVTFSQPGTYHYHCTIHPSIAGEIDVRRVTLATLPTAAIPVGETVDFSGVTTHGGEPVLIERRLHGSGFATIARTRAKANGSWHVAVPASRTGDYRAASGSDISEIRRLLVSVRTVHIRATRKGVDVEVTPSAPYARVVLETYRQERFGWWPTVRRRLDYVSEARIPVRGGVLVRVVLVDRDGWTPLATSRAVLLGRR